MKFDASALFLQSSNGCSAFFSASPSVEPLRAALSSIADQIDLAFVAD
jgi:hypothetical protein